jgi:hypothetical protein
MAPSFAPTFDRPIEVGPSVWGFIFRPGNEPVFLRITAILPTLLGNIGVE